MNYYNSLRRLLLNLIRCHIPSLTTTAYLDGFVVGRSVVVPLPKAIVVLKECMKIGERK